MFLATLPDMYKDADGNSVERLDDIGYGSTCKFL